MLTPAEADAAIAAVLAQLPEQELPLADCAGRVLRREVCAERDAPPFDRVAMDGIAFAASAARRRCFRIAGVQMASGPNVSANLNEAKRLIEIAVEQGAKLIALPEYFAIMGLKDTDKVAPEQVIAGTVL